MRAALASAWLTTLDTAPWAMRSSPASTRMGSGTASPSTSTPMSRPPASPKSPATRASASRSEDSVSGAGASAAIIARVSARLFDAARRAVSIFLSGTCATPSGSPLARTSCSAECSSIWIEERFCATVSCSSCARRSRSWATPAARSVSARRSRVASSSSISCCLSRLTRVMVSKAYAIATTTTADSAGPMIPPRVSPAGICMAIEMARHATTHA